MLRTVLLAALFFLLAFAGTWFFSRQDATTPAVGWQLQQPCQLQQAPCTAEGDTGRMHFSIDPATIPLMQELTATLKLEGVRGVRAARVVVEGVNMFMGYQQAALSPAAEADIWQGAFTLPICSNTHMEWKATITLQTATGDITAIFPFETNR